MPIEQVAGGFRWGQHGVVYPTREGAERQAAAARAHGYTGDQLAAAGVLVRAGDGNVLFLKRSGDGDHTGEWCLPGGGLEFDEGPESAARRELLEETGHQPEGAFKPLARSVDDHVDYTTFAHDVPEYFEPKLNAEHTEHVWAPLKNPPQPLHPGVAALLEKLQASRAMDSFALDRSSVRTVDQDGRLRVEVANISKANVCPYQGREIPGWQEMGLDPDRVYQLLRDPQELEKAAPTFNGIPLLDTHVPSTAWDHPAGKVVGTTGTDAAFEAPYLKNSLVIWTQDAIDGIDSGEQRELSCGYRYRADMTPGTHDGVPYDGVMRDILGNHVALVAAGRAGPDVLVGDSQTLKGNGMTKVKAIARKAAALRGALLVSPKLKLLAADAKVSEIVQAITKANWKEQRPKLEAAIKPKLAQDADMQDIVQLLDVLEREDEGMDDEPPATMPAVDEGGAGEILEMLKGKVGDDVLAAIGEKLKAMKPSAAAPGADDLDKDKEKDMVSKAAMDAALKAANEAAEKRVTQAADAARDEAVKETMARLQQVDQAREVALPYVGKLSGAFDSAEGVYRAALTAMKVEHKDIHPSALRHVLEAQPKPGAHQPRIAADAAGAKGFAERFPTAAAVRSIG